MQVEENTMNQFMTTSKSINNTENKENMKGSTSSNTPPILLKYKGQNYFLFHKSNTSTSQQQEEYQVILPNRDSLFTSDKLNTLMEELSQLFNIQNDVFLFFGNPISLRFGINITYSQELTLSDIAALYFGLRTNSDPFIVELQEDSSNFFREYNALVEKSQEKERSNNVNNSFSSKLEVQEDLNELQEEESSVTTNQTNLNQSSNIIEKEEEQEDDEVNNFAIVDQNEEEQETVAGTSSLVNPSEEVEQQEQNNNEDNEEGDAGLNTESDDHVTGDITAADLDEGFVSVADNEGEEDADNAQQQLNSDEINQLQSEQQVEDATEYIEAADEMQVDEVQSQVQLSQSQQQQQFQSQLNSFENSNSQLESILTKSTSNNAIESTSSSSFINAAQTQATDSTTEDQNSLANVEEEVEEQENESTKSNAKKREREDSSNGYSSQEDILIDANGNYLETELNDNRYYEPAFKRQKVEATI